MALLPARAMSDLVESAHLFYSLFKAESEIKSWYEIQAERLAIQVISYSGDFYSTSPTLLIEEKRRQLETKKKRLAHDEGVARGKVDRIIRQLKDLRLIRQ